MTVAHLGPPLARTGGPAGYLLQLRDALAHAPARHRILLPDERVDRAHEPPRRSLAKRLGRRIVRTVIGGPKFYRASAASLARRGGELDDMLRRALDDMARASAPSLDRAAAERADVLVAHDLGTAAAALERRARGQSVWLMLHTPMSTALYLAWNWGVPEQDWRAVLDYPDVRFWTGYELEICERVDRLVLPCREAADEFVRCDARFAPLLGRAEIVATGATRGGRSTPRTTRAAMRATWGLPVDQPVGLFLGTIQPYRGFDALVQGLDGLADRVAVPGVIAVAGPEPGAVPVHDRLRALGRVADVSTLLAAVDFVINVNRFSLFDLSLIEALEAGKPLLLHDAGGNRAFRALGAGCVALPDLRPSTVARGLERFFSMPHAETAALGGASRACYEGHLTPAHFARRHVALYDRTAARRAAASLA